MGDDTLVSTKYGPSVGWFQVRTLVDPLGFAVYDRVRDIGVLAGRAPGVQQAPDATTVEAAALAQAKAAYTLVQARGWDLWTIYRSGAFEAMRGQDYPLQLGHPKANRWNLTGKEA